jgi:hypothetical protein
MDNANTQPMQLIRPYFGFTLAGPDDSSKVSAGGIQYMFDKGGVHANWSTAPMCSLCSFPLEGTASNFCDGSIAADGNRRFCYKTENSIDDPRGRLYLLDIARQLYHMIFFLDTHFNAIEERCTEVVKMSILSKDNFEADIEDDVPYDNDADRRLLANQRRHWQMMYTPPYGGISEHRLRAMAVANMSDTEEAFFRKFISYNKFISEFAAVRNLFNGMSKLKRHKSRQRRTTTTSSSSSTTVDDVDSDDGGNDLEGDATKGGAEEGGHTTTTNRQLETSSGTALSKSLNRALEAALNDFRQDSNISEKNITRLAKNMYACFRAVVAMQRVRRIQWTYNIELNRLIAAAIKSEQELDAPSVIPIPAINQGGSTLPQQRDADDDDVDSSDSDCSDNEFGGDRGGAADNFTATPRNPVSSSSSSSLPTSTARISTAQLSYPGGKPLSTPVSVTSTATPMEIDELPTSVGNREVDHLSSKPPIAPRNSASLLEPAAPTLSGTDANANKEGGNPRGPNRVHPAWIGGLTVSNNVIVPPDDSAYNVSRFATNDSRLPRYWQLRSQCAPLTQMLADDNMRFIRIATDTGNKISNLFFRIIPDGQPNSYSAYFQWLFGTYGSWMFPFDMPHARMADSKKYVIKASPLHRFILYRKRSDMRKGDMRWTVLDYASDNDRTPFLRFSRNVFRLAVGFKTTTGMKDYWNGSPFKIDFTKTDKVSMATSTVDAPIANPFHLVMHEDPLTLGMRLVVPDADDEFELAIGVATNLQLKLSEQLTVINETIEKQPDKPRHFLGDQGPTRVTDPHPVCLYTTIAFPNDVNWIVREVPGAENRTVLMSRCPNTSSGNAPMWAPAATYTIDSPQSADAQILQYSELPDEPPALETTTFVPSGKPDLPRQKIPSAIARTILTVPPISRTYSSSSSSTSTSSTTTTTTTSTRHQ